MPYLGDSVQAQLARYQRRFTVLRGVLQATRNQESIEHTVSAFLSAICQGFAWPLGFYFEVSDASGSAFVPTKLRFPSDGQHSQLVRALHERGREANGEGIDGAIRRSHTPRWIPNVTLEPTFESTKLVVALGVRGLVGIPIHGGGRLFGMVEFFTREEFNPSPDQVDFLADLGNILGASVHFYELDRRARKVRQEQEIVFEQIQDPVYIVDRAGRATFANASAARLFGVSKEDLLGRQIHELYHRTTGPPGLSSTECPVHGQPVRTMDGVKRREKFRTAADEVIEVEAVAAPFVAEGIQETVVVLRRP